MSSETHHARLGVRLSGGGSRGSRGSRSRSVQACVTASRETGRPVRREPHRPAGGRAEAGPVAGVVVGTVTRVTRDTVASPAVSPPERGRRRPGVRLTRRGRIVLTCGWTMIAGVVLWVAVLLTG